MVDYDNIDDITNLLYEFIYKEKKDYLYVKPKPEEIVFNDIIKNNEFDYNKILDNGIVKKDNIKLIDIIEDKIIVKKYMKTTYPLTLIIQKYNPKFQETLSIIDIYYELYINYLINEYVIFDKIPFYLLNICSFNIQYSKLKEKENFKELVNAKFKNISDNDKFCISVYEHYASYISLKDLLTEELSNEDLLNILFQVLFSYSYFIYKIGSFRHNNFNIDCFLVEKLSEPTILYLKIGDHSFKLKTSFICKLFNYRKAQIYILSNEIDCDIDNPSYDIYTFLLSMYNFNNINNEKIKIIINELISEDIIIKNIKNENIFIKEYNGTIIPNQLLIKNNLFTRFIYMPKQPLNRSMPKNKSKQNKSKQNKSKQNKILETKTRKIQLKRSVKKGSASSSSTETEDMDDKLKKNKKIVSSSSSSDDDSSDSNVDNIGIAKDNRRGSIDDKTLDEETENEEDSDDDSVDDLEDAGIEESDDSDEMSGGFGKTDLKKINKLKNKINKIKEKYKGGNKEIFELKKKSQEPKSFGDFLGKNDNMSSLNGGIPFSLQELQKYGEKKESTMDMFSKPDSNVPQYNMNMPQQPDINMFLHAGNNMPQNDMAHVMNMQQGNNMPQNDMAHVMNMPQNDMAHVMNMPKNDMAHVMNMQQGMNMPQNDMAHVMNMPQTMNIPNAMNMPIMNGGGKGKLPSIPILPNFFFHHK